MGAPTWPPTPEDFYREQMEETGLDEAALGIKDPEDEEAEQALLAAFLFASPRRQLADGQEVGTTLAQVQRRVGAWLRMVSGMDFEVGASDPPSTDGHNLFLPRALPAPADPLADETLYRAMGLVQLGLVRWGFLSRRPLLVDIYRDWVLRSVVHLLAARWIVGRWRRDWPGIARDFDAVEVMERAGRMRVNVTEVPRDGMPEAFLPLYAGLTVNLNWPEPGPVADPVRDAVRAVDAAATPEAAMAAILGHAQRLRGLYRRLRLGPPPLPFFVGIIRPEWILADLSGDREAEEEWRKGQLPLRQLLAARARKGRTGTPGGPPGEPEAAPVRGLRRRLRGRLRRALRGSGPDLAKMPAYGPLRDEAQEKARRAPAGERRWSPDLRVEDLVEGAPATRPSDEDGRFFDEWDHRRGIYRLAEARVRMPEAPTGPLESYERIVQAWSDEIRSIRRRFAALRVEERWVGGQPDGPEIDLHRAIVALTDIAAGQQPREDFHRRFVRRREEVAVLTLVDLSGSTQGRVIHLEQAAIVLVAEGLRTLGMPHAFYGFNGVQAQDCRLYRIKGFDERYDERVRRRLGNLRPEGGSRLGAYVRAGTWLLAQRPQGRRVLLMLSDGRPEDRGDYRGTYGVRDTAMAVQEAARAGVHVHCISLDPSEEAPDYLRTIFGSHFLALREVESLPVRLPEVLRRLIR